MINFFEHFKSTIHSEFNFLKEFGFNEFEEQQIAYEFHLIARSNDDIVIDFHIEMISSTPIWISINGIYLEKIFESNPVFENYNTQRNQLNQVYKNSKVLKTNEQTFPEKNLLINESYLRQVKKLLIENIIFLKDSTIYSNLSEQIRNQNELSLAEYYKHFTTLFDSNFKILIDEEILKSKLENHVLIVETDKVTFEITSYDQYLDFFDSIAEMKNDPESIVYKFEPK